MGEPRGNFLGSVSVLKRERPRKHLDPSSRMDRRILIVIYVAVMAAVIIGVDFAFFKNRFWERLIVNIGLVLVFGAFYLRFLMRP